jgi:putative transposase
MIHLQVTRLVDIRIVSWGADVLYYSFVNLPRCTPENYIDFLVASPGPVSCTEAARVQPRSHFAPAHDSYNRLLNRLESHPEELWEEAEPLVEKARGALIIDDSTLDKRRSKHIGLVTRHWSGKEKKVIRGINLITMLWSDGDRKIPCDYRFFSKLDGKTKHDHFWEMLLMAKARGFSPKYVLFDSWYARLENLKQVRDYGWFWLTRLRGDRKVSAADRRERALDEVPVSESGTVLHLRGYGLVKVFRIDTPDGDTEYWATNDLSMDEGMRRQYAEMSFAIENYHRDLKQHCGVERCQVRASRAQRNHIGWAIRAFLRLEWHFFTTGISAFQAKLGLVRDAVRTYLARPCITLAKPATA